MMLTTSVVASDSDIIESDLKKSFNLTFKSYYDAKAQKTKESLKKVHQDFEDLLNKTQPNPKIRGKTLYVLGSMDYEALGIENHDFPRAYARFVEAYGCDLKMRNKFQVMYAVTRMDYEGNGLELAPSDHIADTLKSMCRNPELHPDTKKHAQKLLKRVQLKEQAHAQVQLALMDKQDQGTSNHEPDYAGVQQDFFAQVRQGYKEVVKNSEAFEEDKASAQTNIRFIDLKK